ncbi:4509_t:CDS:2, partial [Acaulospora colombiana]
GSPSKSLEFVRRIKTQVCEITNGSVIEISHTGTAILLKPGVLTGGPVTHDCPLSRSIGYFLEPIIAVAPFSKKPLMLTLRGITTDDKDLSVDIIRTVTLPHLTMFGVEDGVELKIRKRGAPPGGGGEVQFISPVVRTVKTLNFVNAGRVKRIRGIAHAVRISPQFSNRMIEASRSVLNRYIPDIYIHSDVYKGEESGKSPGYALSLLAETTEGALFCAEAVSTPRSDPHQAKPGKAKRDKIFGEDPEEGPLPTTPEDVALAASRSLLLEIQKGGCVDRKHQWLILLYMALGSEDVGRVKMGPLSPRRQVERNPFPNYSLTDTTSIQFLRDLKDTFGTSFKINPVDEANAQSELLLSCYGTGFINVNRGLA